MMHYNLQLRKRILALPTCKIYNRKQGKHCGKTGETPKETLETLGKTCGNTRGNGRKQKTNKTKHRGNHHDNHRNLSSQNKMAKCINDKHQSSISQKY